VCVCVCANRNNAICSSRTRYSKEFARPFLEKTRPFREPAQQVFLFWKIGLRTGLAQPDLY